MKTRKLLGIFMFLSVLGFLFAGCASLATEKQASLPPDTQTPIISTVEALSPSEPFIMQPGFLPFTPGKMSLLSSTRMFAFPMDELKSPQSSSTAPLEKLFTKPAKLWMLESPAYWQRQYDFMQKNPFYNNPYNRPLVDSLQERHLREQAEMFQKNKDGTYLPKPFSPDLYENHFKDLKIESLPRNLPTAPVIPKFDIPENPIIIRK
jgi:hypothetical protein